MGNHSTLENVENVSAFSSPFVVVENQNGGQIQGSIVDTNDVFLNFNHT